MRISRALVFALAPALLPVVSLAQQADAARPKPSTVAEARERLAKAEAEHPGNTVEVAEALDDLVDIELENDEATEETLTLAQRELAVAQAAASVQSKTYVNALSNAAQAYVAMSRASDGRPLAERAFEIAQKEFPDSEEGIDSADELAYACMALGDYACAQHADETAMATERKLGKEFEWDLAVTLSNYSDLKRRLLDEAGSGAAIEEALAVGTRARPNDPHIGVFENNVASRYMRVQEFPKAIEHLNRSIDIFTRAYGAESPYVLDAMTNVASVYSRTGQFALAWKTYETAFRNKNQTVDSLANEHADFARSLAAGGNLSRAIEEGLLSARMSRESFVLQARTLPERQALAYDRIRPRAVDTAFSVLLRHPELPMADVYQEMVRSRALVADEMARRQKNLNANNDPDVARMLKELNQARADLLAVEQSEPGKNGNGEAIREATAKMEKIERALAERSSAIRNDERMTAVRLEDLRRNLPAHSVLISYVAFTRRSVQAVDPARKSIPSYLAFVIRPDSERIHIFDLGDAKIIEDLVKQVRASADAEAHGGGLGSIRNERTYRVAGEALRKRVWDPVRTQAAGAKLALVVPDGVLNLVPFAGLPEGKGYLVEHGPVIHLLSSERDLVPSTGDAKKSGLLAIGSPRFDMAAAALPSSPAMLRDAEAPCDKFNEIEFHPLPGTSGEIDDIDATWRRWNQREPADLATGADATRARFLEDAPRSRVLHVATHAFVLDKNCGNGNPLLHSGLVFAGANQQRESSILTAQQIASLDLSGVDWAVLSACNTGNGELRDGEGVLGLERAFRVAGARSVIMTLWAVDDEVSRRFMHELYAERLERHASTANAVWNASRTLLEERRAAGKSTHPWYWTGFVGSGGWE